MYRCYIVWNKNIWVTVLPAVILLLSIGESWIAPDSILASPDRIYKL